MPDAPIGGRDGILKDDDWQVRWGAVLNAMATRDVSSDEASALLLVEDAAAGGPAPGAAVLKAAKEPDAPRVNRLLAVWAVTLDAQRPRLKDGPLNQRREAISALSQVGPLGAAQLEGLLADADATIRVAAARAIARGEGQSLGSLGHARRKSRPGTGW